MVRRCDSVGLVRWALRQVDDSIDVSGFLHFFPIPTRLLISSIL